MKNILTEKTQQHKYLPGLSGYGIDGKPGKDGASGKMLFFTDYDVYADFSNMQYLSARIAANKMLISTSDAALDREYANGDYILFSSGKIVEIIDIDTLKSMSIIMTKNSLDEVFNACGDVAISTDNERNYFVMFNNRLSLTSANDVHTMGLDVITVNDKKKFFDVRDGDGESNSAVLRIMSDVTGDDGCIDFIVFKSCFNIDNNDKLRFSYDTGAEAFVIKADSPIKIEAPAVKFALSESPSSMSDDKFSSVILNDNPITEYANTCSMLEYSYVAPEKVDAEPNKDNPIPEMLLEIHKTMNIDNADIDRIVKRGIDPLMCVKAIYEDDVKTIFIAGTDYSLTEQYKDNEELVYKVNIAKLVKLFAKDSVTSYIVDGEQKDFVNIKATYGDMTLWEHVAKSIKIISVSMISNVEIYLKKKA